jgi:TorA maturation chaperone TorD
MTKLPENEELARAGLYALFANLFYLPPSANLLQAIAHTDDVDAFSQVPLAQAGERLRRASEVMDAEAAADEFQTLFVGAGSGGEVMPYGSWHLTGFLMEEPLANLRVDLAELGFDRVEGVSEPEDHIAALCETMRLLIENGSPLSQQKVFFMRHVAPWGEKFAAQLESAPGANYYRHVAQLLREFLQIEMMSFDMLEQ